MLNYYPDMTGETHSEQSAGPGFTGQRRRQVTAWPTDLGRHVLGLLLAGLVVASAPAQDAPRAGEDPAAGLGGPERQEELPPELEGVGIDEHLDAKLPLEMKFKDHEGREVKLGDYFGGEKPVILTLNYYRCPMLCGLQLNGMVDGLKELDWVPGEQFEIVTISFDPLETPTLAKLKRQNYLEYYGRPEAAAGWHFLTGSKQSIDAVLDATGFKVRWSDEQDQWLHLAALIMCTPDGRISRYLYGVMYQPKTLRLSLVEASEGKIGSTVDRILLFCYHYDPDSEGYTLAAFNLVRAGGVLTLVVLAIVLIALWRREKQPVAASPDREQTSE